MDAVAKAIVDVAFIDQTPPTSLNLVHPYPIDWITLISNIRDAVKQILGLDVALVPFQDWLSQLEKRGSGATAEDMASTVSVNQS